jgi:AcrR family transcriptional regulator
MSARSAPGLRERKKAQIRRTIQEQALRLFLAKGFEATSVEEIAAAAGVSHMTFFRYFPTKEDVVLADEYDPLIGELVAGRPPEEPVAEKIRHALVDGLTRVYGAEREALLVRTRLIMGTPALRARLWDQAVATQNLIARALTHQSDDGDLRRRVVVSACFAAISAAVFAWAESNGARELPDLFDEAFVALRREFGSAGER